MNYQFGNRLHTDSGDRLHTSPSRHSDSRPRFQRNSPHSNRTSPSRSSEDSPVHQKFIKFDKISKVRLDPDDFFQGFSSEFVKTQQEEESKSVKRYSRSRENSLVQIKTLEKELSKRERDYEEIKADNSRLREALDRQIEKRKNAEKNLKSTTIMLSELQRKCREYDLNVASLSKQVRFLQEKKYTKQDKIQFSYREKGLLEEIKRIKAAQIVNSSLQFLQRENRRLSFDNESVRTENQYLRIAQRTIINRLLHFQKQLKVAIKLEEEFFQLRHKYEHLAKKERLERKELQKLKKQLKHEEEGQREESLASLTYSSSSAKSIPKGFVRTLKYHSNSRRPNGS